MEDLMVVRPGCRSGSAASAKEAFGSNQAKMFKGSKWCEF